MREAIVPSAVVAKLLASAPPELVLVGGQALKVWVDRYEVTLPAALSFVSRDVDFLARSAADADAVRALARALGGRAIFPKRRAALTALVGQAVKEVAADEVLNVDVLHRVFGADDDGVRARAVEVRLPEVSFRVMHPLDVLKSRLDNLHGLPEKQNELGEAQLRAAIAVVRAFLVDAARTQPSRARRPPTLRFASFIDQLARSAAGKKVAVRYGIHVADAVEPSAVPSREFHEKALPGVLRLMSGARRRELEGGA